MKSNVNAFYSMSFFANGQRTMFYQYVTDTRKACDAAIKSQVKWDVFRLYERKTRKYIGTYKYGDWDAKYPL